MRRTKRWLVVCVAVLASAGTVAACSGDGGSSSSARAEDPTTTTKPAIQYTDMTGQPKVTVEAVDNNMVPQFVEVSKGTVITFVNKGRNIHNLIPVDPATFPAVESGQFDPGAVAEIPFNTVGEFGYYCTLHGTSSKGMFGSIKVV